MFSTTNQPDSELFCTAETTQAKPERHPSTLVPGGHASPLRHPTVLRPGAGQHHHHHHHHHHTPKSSEDLRSHSPSASSRHSPKPIYKAYSPPTTTQDPRASVIANEIEGYFTALDVAPLHITKPSEQLPHCASPNLPHGRESPVQRCSSPPVPPKVRIEEEAQPSATAHELQSPRPEAARPVVVEEDSTESASPPAYDESERVSPPPEKAQAHASRPASRHDDLPAAAAFSAAHVGGSVAGIDSEEALAQNATAGTGDATAEAGAEVSGDSNNDSSPPPLPPRSTSGHEQIQPDSPALMPGAFPPPPKRSPSPRASAPQNGVKGAVASSATAVGAAVAMPSTDFAHGGLRQARNVLGKHVKHMVDRAKEHHEHHLAKKTSASRVGAEDGRTRNVLVVAPIS